MSDRPLLICDADEVLVQFASTFETYLGEQGYRINFASFALSGNIHHRDTGLAATRKQIGQMVDDFFADRVEACPPVPGAVDALRLLSRQADIVVLTNIPAAQEARRAAALAAHGMAFKVYSNDGPKGPAVKLLAGTRLRVAFIDDMASHHQSVAETISHVHRLHLVADVRLRSLIPPAPYAHARIDDWPEALPYLQAVLG
jgi:beta-phosphoglucomutase-like phosphatase (HAD superfamily)